MQKFELYSDLHLEMLSTEDQVNEFLKQISPPQSDYLFLAGDISHIDHFSWSLFWDYCSKHWKQVFVILGNHEYYIKKPGSREPMIELEKRYEDFFKKIDNVYLLKYGHVFYLSDWDRYIIGCTGWSRPSFTVSHLINDFKFIHYSDTEHLTPQHMHNLHEKEFNWILSKLQSPSSPDDRFFVMTHFPPISNGVSHPRFENDCLSSYFKNNYPCTWETKVIWCFGHTHYSSVQNVHNTVYLSNQFGYTDEYDTKVLCPFIFPRL